jgi:glyoxylase-like metal-dependent hydrolase (beta-lactamase superfamily II)
VIVRVEQSDWLSNAYLVFDEPGGKGVLVDSNSVTDPLAELAEREGIEITQLLLTHHHYDHVVGARKLADRFGAPIVAHELTDELIDEKVDETFTDGATIETGNLRIEAIHTPGHCADHCALAINGTDVLTADVLFKGTVGGTRAPGATGFADLKHSVMERLMTLPPETRIHPGHREPSTIGEEWESNPFVRIWRGLDEEGAEAVSIGPADADHRDEATMVLWAPDYDGGNKAWVRWDESGEDDIVPGSQVVRGDGS